MYHVIIWTNVHKDIWRHMSTIGHMGKNQSISLPYRRRWIFENVARNGWHVVSISMRGTHYDVIEWKIFLRYWPFVQVIHQSPVNFRHKGLWRRVLMFLWSALEQAVNKQSRRRGFETQSRSLWRHCYTLVLSTCPIFGFPINTCSQIIRNADVEN